LQLKSGRAFVRSAEWPQPNSLANAGSAARAGTFAMAGVIAQLGERFNGIEEVGGSIPPGSTN
jgi:hypothetical protein